MIARGTVVLCEYSQPGLTGSFATVSRRILEKIPNSGAKMSYMYDHHIFNYIAEEGMIYLCMGDEASGSTRVAFAYLEDIRNRFRATYGDRARTASEGQMTEDFSRIIETQMKHFSNSSAVDKISRVRTEIDEVRNVMVQGIEKVLERGEKAELLVNKAENLNNQTTSFKTYSTALKNAMWWKNIKLLIAIGVVLIIIAYFITAIACGGILLNKCVGKSSSSTTTTSTTTSSTTTSSTSGTTSSTTGTTSTAPTTATTSTTTTTTSGDSSTAASTGTTTTTTTTARKFARQLIIKAPHSD